MSETTIDWFSSNLPEVLLLHLGRQHRIASRPGGKRKCRLTACAAARTVWELLPDKRYQNVVEASERHANRVLRHSEVRSAQENTQEIQDLYRGIQNTIQSLLAFFGMGTPEVSRTNYANVLMEQLALKSFGVMRTQSCCSAVTNIAVFATGMHYNPTAREESELRICHAIRDLFGAVVQDFVAPTQWRTPHVLGLCRSFQDDPSQERILILADALEEAGCEDLRILSHCRDEGPHYRGCWVVDSLLGIDIKKARKRSLGEASE